MSNNNKSPPLKRKAEEDIESVAKKAAQQQSDISANKWWNVGDNYQEDDPGKKWDYLEHNGVIFPPFYKPHKIRINYKGEPISLNPKEEELATYWSQTIGSEWETKKIYRTNFSKSFLELLQKSHPQMQIKKFEDFDFSPIVKHLEEQKEIKKNRGPEEKKKEKEEKAKKDEKYGFCIVDGITEKVGGYMIEPPTLFKGRGEHPKAGFMKGRILPEDITINIAKNAPVPRCDIPGRSWKDVMHNNEVTWLAYYKDDTINVAYKYIFLAASSKFKGLNDMKKYEKARKLKDKIESIRSDYRKKLIDKSEANRQLGTATYLIDSLALRVGNEKSEDEADTVGCCSLRFEHIKMEEDYKITLDFLGKDSMRYFNTVKIDQTVWNNLNDFVRGKKEGDDLFDKINASSLNDYLRSLMEGLTAKVFRTYNASITLENELNKKNVEKMSVEEKVNYYDEANKQVAILCNHQKTVPKNFDLMKEKLGLKIDVMRQYLKELQSHLKKLKKGGDVNAYEETVMISSTKKEEGEEEKNIKKQQQKDEKPTPYIKRFPATEDKAESLIKKLEINIEKEDSKLVKKEENKSIALGTSKINYNDPRITVSWCKRNEVPIEKVFQKALRTKFPWAMHCEPEWKF